jgi:hypothetical protein
MVRSYLKDRALRPEGSVVDTHWTHNPLKSGYLG